MIFTLVQSASIVASVAPVVIVEAITVVDVNDGGAWSMVIPLPYQGNLKFGPFTIQTATHVAAAKPIAKPINPPKIIWPSIIVLPAKLSDHHAETREVLLCSQHPKLVNFRESHEARIDRAALLDRGVEQVPFVVGLRILVLQREQFADKVFAEAFG